MENQTFEQKNILRDDALDEIPQIYRLEYHSKQRNFHLCLNVEPVSKFGWNIIMNKIPDEVAEDFIDYAEENLLNGDNFYTWMEMQKLLHEWLSK